MLINASDKRPIKATCIRVGNFLWGMKSEAMYVVERNASSATAASKTPLIWLPLAVASSDLFGLGITLQKIVPLLAQRRENQCLPV